MEFSPKTSRLRIRIPEVHLFLPLICHMTQFENVFAYVLILKDLKRIHNLYHVLAFEQLTKNAFFLQVVDQVIIALPQMLVPQNREMEQLSIVT